MMDTPPVLFTDRELMNAVTRFQRKLRHYFDPKRWGPDPKERPPSLESFEVSAGLRRLERAFEETQRIRWYEAEKKRRGPGQ